MSTGKNRQASSKKSEQSSSAPKSTSSSANSLALTFDVPASSFEDDLQKAFDMVAGIDQSINEEKKKEIGDVESYMETDLYKQTMAAANSKKSSGTISVIGMIVQANEYPRVDGITKKTVRSFLVTMRVTRNSISDTELARIGGKFVDDVYGGHFEIPIHCNLGPNKFKDYISAQQLNQSNVDAMQSIASSVSSGTKKRHQIEDSQLGSKPNKRHKLDNGDHKKTSSSSEPVVEEVEDEKTDDNSMAVALVNSNKQLSTSTTFDSGNVNQSNVDENGTPVFKQQDINGKSYVGRDIVILMHLPINKDIKFNINEKTMTVDPSAWTLVNADIKPTPYISNTLVYNANSWIIDKFSVKQKISTVNMYKYFEMVAQSSPVCTQLYEYLESARNMPKKTFVKGEKRQSTPLEDSSLTWFVTGNELSQMHVYGKKDDGWHVRYELVRNRKVEQFKKIDPETKPPNEKVIGTLPYQFDVMQWKGTFSPTNNTIYKCKVFISVSWKHICPSSFTSENYKPQANNSLQINSITAWVCLMCANYPHLKLAINAKESFDMNAQIQLNTDRYARAKIMNAPEHMMQPRENAKDRLMLPLFYKHLFFQKVILLPLETIKSCCIPVTQAYIVEMAWKGRSPPQTNPGVGDLDSGANAVPMRPIDMNNNVHNLSESQNTEQFFTDKINEPNNRFNFYAMTNVCFKSSDGHDDSAIKMLKFLPRSAGEGIIWLEALRHIVCNGALKGCYKTEKGSFPEFGKIANSEKYIQYLKSIEGLPEKSNLYNINLDDLQIFHEASKLVVYFYAVSKLVDDADNEKGKILSDLNSGLNPEMIKVLTNAPDDNDDENSNDQEAVEQDDNNEDGDNNDTQVDANGAKNVVDQRILADGQPEESDEDQKLVESDVETPGNEDDST